MGKLTMQNDSADDDDNYDVDDNANSIVLHRKLNSLSAIPSSSRRLSPHPPPATPSTSTHFTIFALVWELGSKSKLKLFT